MAVAAPAGERKVVDVGRAAVLLRYDVVDLVRVKGEIGRELTVFAAAPAPSMTSRRSAVGM